MNATKTKKDLPLKYKVVADCIRVGKQNATLLSDIMNIANIKDRRQAYVIIERLINDYGYVIGASRQGEHKGYYIPANDAEMNEILNTFKSSIESMEERYKNLIDNYKNVS